MKNDIIFVRYSRFREITRGVQNLSAALYSAQNAAEIIKNTTAKTTVINPSAGNSRYRTEQRIKLDRLFNTCDAVFFYLRKC